MPSTLKNAQLAERYLQLFKENYSEPAYKKLLGSFITDNFLKPSTSHTKNKLKVCNEAKQK